MTNTAQEAYSVREIRTVIGAEVEHGWGQKTEAAGAWKPPPASAAPIINNATTTALKRLVSMTENPFQKPCGVECNCEALVVVAARDCQQTAKIEAEYPSPASRTCPSSGYAL
jgi:hypothetical protein